MNKINKKIKVPVAFTAIIVLIFSIVMVWGFSSSWGYSGMQRITFSYTQGDSEYTGSAILFTPEDASEDNQTPCIVILGGASSYSYALKAYGVELARRGYTVILCDMPGQGQSNFVGGGGGYGNYQETAGEDGGGEDVSGYIAAVTQQALSLNYVDTDKMVLAGFSAGQSWAVQAATSIVPGVYQTVGTFSGYRESYRDTLLEAGINYFGISATSSAPSTSYETVQGEITGTGSFEDGTADYCYWHTSAVQHQMQPTTPGLVLGICEMMEMIYPTEAAAEISSTIFMGAEVFSGVAIICLFVLIACLLKAFLSMNIFRSLFRSEPEKFPAMCSKAKTLKGHRIKATVFLSGKTLLTIILYEIFAARTQIIPLFEGWAAAGLWINIWVPFLISTMIVNAVIFIVWHFTIGKKEGGNAYKYGLGWGNAKNNIINIGKSLLLGLCIVFIVLSVLNFMDSLLTINFKVMIFGMISFNMEHLLQMPAYILLYFGLLFTASLTQYITNPVLSDGTTKGNVIATIKTTFIAIFPYLVMVIWNTFKGTGAITMAGTYTTDQFAPMDNLYGYPIMMALVTPIMDVLRRRTKSIWPGVIVCAMLLGVLIACNYSLNASWFG